MTLRHLLFHNVWIKLLSLALATVIWFAIRFGIQDDLNSPPAPVLKPTQKSAQITVNVLTQPGDARIFKVSPESVAVTINGEEAMLRKYSSKDLMAYVDLTAIERDAPTNQEVKLHLPSGISVRSILPQAVNVEQVSP